MLTLTDETIEVITTTVDVWALPESAGLRLAANPSDEDPSELTIEAQVVEEPEVSDAMVEVAGARVYLDSVAGSILDDKVLDIEPRPGGKLEFKVFDQTEYAAQDQLLDED